MCHLPVHDGGSGAQEGEVFGQLCESSHDEGTNLRKEMRKEGCDKER